jgi:uncharacterized protein (TIGR00730 family)
MAEPTPEQLPMSSPVAVIFGGSSPRPGDTAYTQAERLGSLLVQAGFAIMTGGYGGTMLAASKGAAEAGGHVIGVTAGQLERNMGQKANPYVDEVVHYDTLRDRLYHLVERSDASVALPGGIGTLSEVALTWSLLQVGEIALKPFVLLGTRWRETLLAYYGTGEYISQADMALWRVVDTPEEVVTVLTNWPRR